MLVVAEREYEQLPVQAARAGSPEAWNALFKRYQLPLYVYLFELLRNEQEALDAVQETFINASRHIAHLRDDRKFGSWLFGIAHQKCIQSWRKQNRRSRIEDPSVEALPDPPDDDDPSELLIRKEQEADFMRLIENLPPPQRSVLLLHFVEEFTIEEIGSITGALPGTVKSRLHYARKALRKELEKA